MPRKIGEISSLKVIHCFRYSSDLEWLAQLRLEGHGHFQHHFVKELSLAGAVANLASESGFGPGLFGLAVSVDASVRRSWR